MTTEIKVYVEGIGEVHVDESFTLEDLSKQVFQKDYKRYLGARINNQIYYLSKKVKEDMYIRFLDINERDGHRIYTRTISAVFIMACKEIFPQYTAKIEHFLGEGLYAQLEEKSISFKEIDKIKSKMREIVEKDIPIIRNKVPFEEGIQLFEEYGHKDKVRLYNSLNRDEIQIYSIGNHIDSFHGYLAPSTSYVNVFDLKYYYPGAIILFPPRGNENNYQSLKNRKSWQRYLKKPMNGLIYWI